MQALRIAATEMTLGIFHLTRLNKRLEADGCCASWLLREQAPRPHLRLQLKHPAAESPELFILKELLENLIPVASLDHLLLDNVESIAWLSSDNSLLLRCLEVGFCGGLLPENQVSQLSDR